MLESESSVPKLQQNVKVLMLIWGKGRETEEEHKDTLEILSKGSIKGRKNHQFIK